MRNKSMNNQSFVFVTSAGGGITHMTRVADSMLPLACCRKSWGAGDKRRKYCAYQSLFSNLYNVLLIKMV